MKSLFRKIRERYIIFFELGVIFLISLIPLLWFKQGYMVMGQDSPYPIDYVVFFTQRLYMWFASQNFGTFYPIITGQINFLIIQAFLNYIGLQLANVEKVTFVFWFFSMAFTMYLFVRYLYPKNKYWGLRLICVFIYVFNFYLYSFWIQGEQPTFSIYALLPLLVLFMLKFVRKEISPIRTAFYMNISFLIFNGGGIAAIPLLGSAIITIIALTFYFIVIIFKEEKWNLVKRFLYFGIFSFILGVLFNAYYILPFAMSFFSNYQSNVDFVGGISSAVGWAKFITEDTTYTTLFRLQGERIWYGQLNYYSNAYLHNPILIVGSFVFPVLAYLAYFLVKEKREKQLVLSLFLLSLMAIFFSAGANGPLSGVYIFMMEHVFGFAAFRSSYYKFVPALYFSFSILIGISVYYLSEKFLKKFSPIAIIIFLGLILSYHYIYFHPEYMRYNTPFPPMVKVPQYLIDIGNEEKTFTDDYRTLLLPPLADSSLRITTWNYYSLAPIQMSFTDRSFVENNKYHLSKEEYALVDLLYKSLREQNYSLVKELSDRMHIRYFLLTKDLITNYPAAMSDTETSYEKALKNTKYFSKIWQSGPWYIYKLNSSISGKIYPADKLSYYQGNINDIYGLFSISNNHFIANEQINNLTIADPNTNPVLKVYEYDCISCDRLQMDTTDISIPDTKVLPESPFYFIKEILENRQFKIIQANDDVQGYLGFSIKRLSELESFKRNLPNPSFENEWINTVSKLNNYWRAINQYTLSKKNIDISTYNQFLRISNYLNFEDGALKDIYSVYNVGENDPLKVSLANLIFYLDSIKGELNRTIITYQQDNKFTYSLGNNTVNYYLTLSSLPKDNSGNPILPIAYDIDNTRHSLSSQVKGEIYPISSTPVNGKILSIYFNPLPNLATDLKTVSLQFVDRQERCITAPIDSYTLRDSYIVSAKINSKNIYSNVYIKRNYDRFFDSANQEMIKNKYFTPDLAVPLKDNEYNISFDRLPVDKSANVYFCTDSLNDPTKIFSDISVKESVNPKLYGMQEFNLKGFEKPEITYTKNDNANYTVSVKNAKGPYLLVFLERFSPDWHISLIGSSKFANKHFMVEGYANAWYINQTGNYEMKINFSPQKTFQTGVVISLISILGSILLFLIVFIKKKI